MSWWPWECWRERRVAQQHDQPADAAEAVAVRRHEERGLDHARARRPEVDDLADRLRRHRQTNHFAELFMGGER